MHQTRERRHKCWPPFGSWLDYLFVKPTYLRHPLKLSGFLRRAAISHGHWLLLSGGLVDCVQDGHIAMTLHPIRGNRGPTLNGGGKSVDLRGEFIDDFEPSFQAASGD